MSILQNILELNKASESLNLSIETFLSLHWAAYMIWAKFQCSEPSAKQNGKEVEFKVQTQWSPPHNFKRVLQAINFIFAYGNITPL